MTRNRISTTRHIPIKFIYYIVTGFKLKIYTQLCFLLNFEMKNLKRVEFNCKVHLIVVKVKPLNIVVLPSFPGALFLSFLKADYCPPIQAFRKAKEHKDRGWNATSCNFRLPGKNNLNRCVVVFFIKCVLNTCK